MTSVRLASSDAATVKADALVIGTAAGPSGVTLAAGADAIDAALHSRLRTALQQVGAIGRRDDVVRIPMNGSIGAPLIVATGLGAAPGRDGAHDPESVRRAVGAAMRSLDGVGHVATTLALVNGTPTPETLAAVAEGALLGSYRFGRYRSNGTAAGPARISILTPATSRQLTAVLRRAETVCAAVALTRDLSNTPANDLHPAELATAARAVAESAGLGVDVLTEKELRKGKYGGLIGVGAGSAHPPRLVRLAYEHPRAKKTIAFVGKGVTFDSGGLSLKPATAMEWMKADMGGAAAVIATMQAIAALKPRVNVIGYVPAAENMPGGTAIRPSDVLTLRGGKTVEVVNTDAEGRLIMADAIARATEDDPDLIVDVATLTGAQLVALGTHTGGVMGNDVPLRSAIVEAARRVGESLWPMPLPKELRASLDSAVADMSNLGERMGGMLVAGLFLQEFIPEAVPWAHIDIAGPAYNQGEPYGYTPKGGTGVPVRTLVQFVHDVADGVI